MTQSKGLKQYKAGKFNEANLEWQPDGSVIIALHQRKGNKHYRFRVRNLYSPDEEELDVTTGKPINKRDI